MALRLRFWARAMVGVAIALGIVLLVAMVTVAPVILNGGIARVSVIRGVDTVTIPGQAFTCELSDRSDRCEAILRGKPLAVAVNYPSSQRQPFAADVTCQGTYGDRSAPCTVAWDFGTGSLPIIHLDDDLGWGIADRRALRQRYLAAQLTEPGWLRLTLGWAALLAAAIALGLGTSLDGTQEALAVAIAGLIGFALALAGLVKGSLNLLSSPMVATWVEENFGPGGSLLLILVLAAIILVAGVAGWGVAKMTGLLFSRLPHRLNRLLISFSGGLGVALITFFGSSWRLPIPRLMALGTAGLTGAIAAAAIRWRPGSLGRVFVSVYGGAVALAALAYLNLWLLLGLGLVD